MYTLLRDVLGLFKIVNDIYARIKKILIPPKAFAWQTLVYLSIFAWVMSSLTEGFIHNLIALTGWIFLIAGTAWYTTDNPLRVPGTSLPVGALITGFLVSVFAFGDPEDIFTTRTIVLWPTLSALITAIPEFFEGNGTTTKAQFPKIEERQKLIVLVASSMVVSCWLQFYFVTSKWLEEYPSLQVESFRRSAFVVRVEPESDIPKNGAIILQKLTPIIEGQVAGRSWSEVEQFLINAKQRIGILANQVIETNLAQFEERSLWRVEPRITNVKSGYRLDLLNIWTGPSSKPQGYYLKRSCRIDPVVTSVRNKPGEKITVAEIECDRVSKLIQESPPAAR